MRSSTMPVSLDGLMIMVVEDDLLAALDLKRLVEQRGGKVAGPVGRLEQAHELARSERRNPRCAAEWCRPAGLADGLIAQGIPVILVTGYDRASLPPRFAETPRLPKPFNDSAFDPLAADLFVGGASPARSSRRHRPGDRAKNGPPERAPLR